MTTAISQPKPALSAIWRNGAIAAIVAAVINAILFIVGGAAGGFPASVLTPMGVPITLPTVLLMLIVPILIGALGYTVLSRITTNPGRWFTILTVIILILMFVTPLQLAAAPTLMVVLLEIMHLVVGGAAIYFLTRS